jgi:hypothetical protein
MEIDLGFVGYITEDKAIKITINEFRGVEYIHIREYMRDGDTGHWYPTKKGLALRPEHVDMAAYLLDQAGDILTKVYLNKLGAEKQLELFEEENVDGE